MFGPHDPIPFGKRPPEYEGEPLSAKDSQVGGDHYKGMAIQPAEYILSNKLGWAEGCAIGYISRWREKGGVQDLQKAIHTLELLIEHEAKG